MRVKGLAIVLVAVGSLLASGASATLPGANGLIAFSGTRPYGHGSNDVWVMHPNGTFDNLTNQGDLGSYDPDWSPDGQKIAYTRLIGADQGLQKQVWVMNADGSGKTQLTSGYYYDDRPAWSPDGSQIAFASTRPFAGDGFVRHIWIMNADGSGLRQLTDDSTTLNSVADDPAWSPDGSTIAFDDYLDLYTMRPDGSAVHRLTTDPTHDTRPSYSPDGQSIAFSTEGSDGDGDVYVMSSSGTDKKLLADRGFAPTWSPDGTKIAFLSSYGTLDVRLWVMRSDGSDQTPLTAEDDRDETASWQRTTEPAPLKCHVPHLVGRRLPSAKRLIRSSHCILGRVTKTRSSLAKKGRIVGQSPKAGTTRPNRARIALRLGKGRA